MMKRNGCDQPWHRRIAAMAAWTILGTLTQTLQAAPEWSIEDGWLTCRDGADELLRAAPGPPVEIWLDDHSLWADAPPDPKVAQRSSGAWEIAYETANGRLLDVWAPFPELGSNAWLRTLTYTNRSSEIQDILWADVRVRPGRLKDGVEWAPSWFRMREAAPGRAACVAWRGTTDFHHIKDGPDGVVYHRVESQWRLQPGQDATIAAQGVWLGRSGVEAFRDEAQRWYRAIGLTTAPAPDWLDAAILYEYCAGGHIDSRFSDVGGFDRLARQTPYLADLGVSAVWLNSVFTHKSPPDAETGGWNFYSPLDFTEIDPFLGGEPALRRLLMGLCVEGIHVIGETVPHGAYSKQAEALPQWWTRRRDGELSAHYGRDMDYASPPWQEQMRQAMAWMARDFGIEGARIDLGMGLGPNWGSPRTNQASFSGLGGCLEMHRALRAGLAEGCPTPIVLAETTVEQPEYFSFTPLSYGISWTWHMDEALGHHPNDPAGLAADLRDELERERGALPEGARTIRTLGCHDEVVDRGGRVHVRMGWGLSRALYGVCLTIPGVPMLYQEDEIGSFEALRALNWARRRVPEMARGEADYTSVAYAPEAFTCLRSIGSLHALGLVNLSGHTVSSAVRLPARAGLDVGQAVYDAVSGREARIGPERSFEWTLGPYETAILRVGRRPESGPPQLRFEGETPSATDPPVPLKVTRRAEAVHIDYGRLRLRLDVGPGPWQKARTSRGAPTWSSPYGRLTVKRDFGYIHVDLTFKPSLIPSWRGPALEVRNAERWLVSARSALLEDRLLRRHFPFPPDTPYRWDRTMEWGDAPWGGLYNYIAPTGRLWQSFLEPLHPERPAVAFEDRDGEALVLRALDSSAQNIVLTDRTDEREGKGCEPPYGLELRFLPTDDLLHPQVRAFGPGQPWRLPVYPPPTPGKQRLSFRVQAAKAPVRDTLSSPPRLPRHAPHAARAEREGAVAHKMKDILWIERPGEIEWSNLAPVAEHARIRLELRHSERGPDQRELESHYALEFDGRPVPLEWVFHDVYHTANAWFGQVVTPPLNLNDGRHTLRLKTTHSWCAVRGDFHILPADWRPRSALHDTFAIEGPRADLRAEWNGQTWGVAPDDSTPDGDGHVLRSPPTTGQTFTSHWLTAPKRWPVRIRAMVRMMPTNDGWATTRLGMRTSGGDVAFVDIPLHVAGLAQLFVNNGTTCEEAGRIEPSLYTAQTGDWLRVSLTVDRESVACEVEKWQLGEWTGPFKLRPVEVPHVPTDVAWQVFVSAHSEHPTIHQIDDVEAQ